MKIFLRILLILILALTGLYFAGPGPRTPVLNGKLPTVTSDLSSLERQIIDREKSIKNIKQDNEARIVWADSVNKGKTEYCLLYLHGFSASQEEGNPVHRNFAKRYGCNLYLPRLYGHGIKHKDAFIDLTPEKLVESAKQAVAVAQQLGKKLIIMSTSTGGSLSLYIAAHNPEIEGLILYSPNIALHDGSATILDKRWGLQVARYIMEGNHMKISKGGSPAEYWTKGYRLEGLITLRSLLDATMKEEIFKEVKQPVFMGYHYKDEDHHDVTVSVPAMLEMYEQLGTSESQRRKVAFADGDHCLGNRFKSKAIKSVEEETYKFAEEVLKMKPVSINVLAAGTAGKN